MKVTPLEIRQKTFEKKLRGYDKEEVQAFLLSLSQEWEKLNEENRELRIKLKTSEKEVEKLREVEESLFKTLKTAEDTGANVIEQANKQAELNVRESQWKAESIINEAKGKAKEYLVDAENKAKYILDDMLEELRKLEKNYSILKGYKNDLLSEIKSISNEIAEKVSRIEQGTEKDIDKAIRDAKEEVRSLRPANEIIREVLSSEGGTKYSKFDPNASEEEDKEVAKKLEEERKAIEEEGERLREEAERQQLEAEETKKKEEELLKLKEAEERKKAEAARLIKEQEAKKAEAARIHKEQEEKKARAEMEKKSRVSTDSDNAEDGSFFDNLD
ncbi:DivIVA domain-containing protein [Marinigracilibium pacificum]|uniref:DivIVA domain-containing protein n=1 Tax=Marinigracilibium pacificum TaxID=2729599 RepID=A0A848IXZ5_9BACT|nr:DivIVA domain-containing protein [Marinigracilibium pacificum]NMM49383.1 DivIVA domain-containing protein [Marinigracilibium pacificum]